MRLVGAMIETARSHSPVGKVRIYGEMVNLLCGHNSVEAAANLEDLWNNILRLHSVPLLCSYSLEMLPANAAGLYHNESLTFTPIRLPCFDLPQGGLIPL